MREKFATDLYELMKSDKNIVFITADLGFGLFDKIKKELPDQFYNVGAAEQAAMDVAVGFALSGKIPIVYSITPFLLFRAFETIRTYIDHENIPVIMVGSGRDDDYKTEGFSHYAGDDWRAAYFYNVETLREYSDLKKVIYANKPVYLNLKR